jgi:putative transposase
MDTPTATTRYKNHRFPVEIISHAVWLYFRFCLSFRDVEELLLERGVIVTYETIRKWCRKFGQQYANQLRRRQPRPGDKWYRDEVFLTIKGERHYLWWAVDQDRNVLDILVQRRRDKQAAKKFLRKLLKGVTYVPRVRVTDKLKSYGAAKREILPSVEHRQHRYLNTRAENSHQPPVSASDACNALSLPVMPSAFSLPMVPSPNTSVHAGIGFPPPPTVKSSETDFRAGRRSRFPLWLPEKQEGKPPLAHPSIAAMQIS